MPATTNPTAYVEVTNLVPNVPGWAINTPRLLGYSRITDCAAQNSYVSTLFAAATTAATVAAQVAAMVALIAVTSASPPTLPAGSAAWTERSCSSVFLPVLYYNAGQDVTITPTPSATNYPAGQDVTIATV